MKMAGICNRTEFYPMSSNIHAGGTISIYQKITVTDEKKEVKELIIEDTGIGIAPEDLPRIFEKGYTGYNGHADKRSTGIGLYLCRKIMRKLSHEITIESEIGVGTKVHLEMRSRDKVIYKIMS